MSRARSDAPAFSWRTVKGRARVRGIIEERVPQWPSGPRDYQLNAWVQTLDNIPLILIASTGAGKTAAFYGPILVMQHLLTHPVEGIP
jgi:ATP-dependent helicase YprA (DUF1998 family)